MLNFNGSSLFFERIKFLYDKMNNKKKKKLKNSQNKRQFSIYFFQENLTL